MRVRHHEKIGAIRTLARYPAPWIRNEVIRQRPAPITAIRLLWERIPMLESA
jgi:hypothetical protein